MCKNALSFDIGVFRKSIYTGLSLNYDSAVSNRYKYNPTIHLLDTADKICSSYAKFCTELGFSYKFFYGLYYSCIYIHKCIRIRLKSVFNASIRKLFANEKLTFVSESLLDFTSSIAIKKSAHCYKELLSTSRT